MTITFFNTFVAMDVVYDKMDVSQDFTDNPRNLVVKQDVTKTSKNDVEIKMAGVNAKYFEVNLI